MIQAAWDPYRNYKGKYRAAPKSIAPCSADHEAPMSSGNHNTASSDRTLVPIKGQFIKDHEPGVGVHDLA